MAQRQNIITNLIEDIVINGLRIEVNRWNEIAEEDAEEALEDRDLKGFLISILKRGACTYADSLLEEEQRRRQKERRGYYLTQ